MRVDIILQGRRENEATRRRVAFRTFYAASYDITAFLRLNKKDPGVIRDVKSETILFG